MTKFYKSSIFNLQYSFPILPVLLYMFITIAPELSSAQTWHTVRWVNDGDTIILDNGKRVRYIGINTPEIDHEGQKAQPYGYQAKSYNQTLVGSHKVRLEYDTDRRDRYGRDLAYVFLKDRRFINARLLQAGLAFYLYRKPNLKYGKILLKAQQDAMASGKGLWHNWREKEQIYLGNRKSKRFHIFSCKFARKINAKNKIQFSSKWEAFYRGYAPAKKCIKEYWSYETGK
jgi:endonuclease YncB( thermonuclease family)